MHTTCTTSPPRERPRTRKLLFRGKLNGFSPVPTPRKSAQMLKTANEHVHAKIRRARAVIGAGVRLKKPELEKEGRQDFATASIENQHLPYGSALTDAARHRLQPVLFDPDPANQ